MVVRVDEAVDFICGVLTGRPPTEQGAIIAMLTARWLAGHMMAGDVEATAELREHLLQVQVDVIRKLIPEEEIEILARVREGSH